MKRITKIVIGLLMATALSWAQTAYAVDNGTEFGVEDDLTVLGTGGLSVDDPDVAIKGFSVFGATQAASSLTIPLVPGSIFVNGYVQVSSGMYVTGGSTFSAGAYFTGVSSFSNAANIFVAGGGSGQILKKVPGGGMVWGNDNTGLTGLGGIRRLQMVNDTGDGLIDSAFMQNALDTNITMLATSSMTVLGAFEARGVTTLTGILNANGAINLGDTAADLVTIQGPVTVMGTSSVTVKGALEVDGAVKLDGATIALGDASTDLLTMNAQATFIGGSTFTTGAYFTGVSSFNNIANIHIAGGSANQVIKKLAGGGLAWGNDSGLSEMGTPRRLQMVNDTDDGLIDSTFMQNATDTNITMLASSSMTVLGAFDTRGATQLGDAVTDIHGVNMAPAAGTALSVAGTANANEYAAKFYSGAALAAWIKKK